VHGLTIVIDFSDQASAYSKPEIEAWLNQPGYQKFGLTGSVRDYYFGQSRGQVDYQNEVHGFYRAKNPKSYYQGGTGYERATELWTEVITALDSEIDFALFDNDGDGKTEAISLLYAGNEGSFGIGLWPHASGSNDVRDGVKLNRYMMAALNGQPTNYTVAHESGHMLFGWPDLYGVGDYCIMANRDSNANPVGINDAFRSDQGWIEVSDLDSTNNNAQLTSLPDGIAYRYLNPARPSEYFLWSNLQNSAEWASLKGGGLLVWHFDKGIAGNAPPAKLELAVVQAAPGSRQLGATTWPSPGSAATDLFAAGRNSELSATTQPSSNWNDGSPSALRLYDISASGPSMQFSIGNGIAPPSSAGGGSGSGGAAGGNTASAGDASGGASHAGGVTNGGTSGSASYGDVAGAPADGGSSSFSGGPTAGSVAVGGQMSLGPSADAMAGRLGAGYVAASAQASGCSCSSAAPRRGALGPFGALSVALTLLVGWRWAVAKASRPR
jgi:M6 family metalloprotease-like protein